MMIAKQLGATMKSVKWVWGVIEIVSVLSLITDQVQAMDSTYGVGHDKVWGGGNGSATVACVNGGGKKWAVLVAGSNGYYNYRHQADVCHAYQILRKEGFNDENIIVFMYDDIADSGRNPRPGIIINKPDGEDVYHGVPKDYTGDDVNPNNLYAVLLGHKSAVTGGSGKVLDSGPNDHVFFYYADHGGAGILGMPGNSDYVYAKDLVEALKKMHEGQAYKSMLIYIEACDGGSIFDGLLPNDISIYATTASNPTENSYATYCPDENPPPPSEYDICIGDKYSVSWMEDSEKNDLKKETVEQQYEAVRMRTLSGEGSSHVEHYGDENLDKDTLDTYMGAADSSHRSYTAVLPVEQPSFSKSASQRDADLVHFRQKLLRASPGSQQEREAQEQLRAEISRREWEDTTVNQIGSLLLGSKEGQAVMNVVRPAGRPLVDDWGCFKNFVNTYEKHCGKLSTYGMKHSRALANLCNAGVSEREMVVASISACSDKTPFLDGRIPGLE